MQHDDTQILPGTGRGTARSAVEGLVVTGERINAYVCDGGMGSLPGLPRAACDHFIITIDREKGVTPFMLKCGNCGRFAYSKMYRVAVDIEPTHEWFKPDSLEGLNPGERDHVERGGLLLRPIEGRGHWLHPNALRLPEMIAQACRNPAA